MSSLREMFVFPFFGEFPSSSYILSALLLFLVRSIIKSTEAHKLKIIKGKLQSGKEQLTHAYRITVELPLIDMLTRNVYIGNVHKANKYELLSASYLLCYWLKSKGI